MFNQLVFASAVYVFFTNLLPGITFASDLYVLTGRNWGTIEVVFSTGLCGVVFSMLVDPLVESSFEACFILPCSCCKSSIFLLERVSMRHVYSPVPRDACDDV